MTRRKRASCSANPTGHRSRERRWHGGPGRDAHEQRQGAAITRQPARGLRQSTTQLAQQQTHQAPPVQNSPSTSCTAPLPVQNSPCSPEMARFGAFSACRESFVPLWLAQHQAGRILYRMRGGDRASHDSTTGPTSVEGTGGAEGGGGTGRYRRVRRDRRARAGFEARGLTAAPAGRARAWSRQISHAIPPRHESTRAQKPRNIND